VPVTEEHPMSGPLTPQAARRADARAAAPAGPAEPASSVRAAAAGDERAWEDLVTRFSPLVRSVARRHRLSPSDQEDVLQRTWLALLQHIGRVKAPEAIVSWLATTARNECLATLRAQRREFPAEELPRAEAVPASTDSEEAFDGEMWMAERRAALRVAVDRIGGRPRAMLELLMADDCLSYAEISARLAMPIGSIGPTRARSLARLRREPEIAGLFDDSVRPARPTRPPRPGGSEVL
jgi:RNA polymerase sigma factor (sigma-70 family)